MNSNSFNKTSNIKEFFRDKSVLITGATGLVGKVLAFKILLSIETVKTIYVLIREKDGKSCENRLQELITKSRDLFTYVNKQSLAKLIPIKGDISKIGLGLSENDTNIISETVSIVFHSAADVTFNTDLRKHLLINVCGTKEVIDLCRKMKHFLSFVYVSTAYSNPLELVIEEKIYKHCDNITEVMEIARNTNKEMIAKDYLHDFPNTYMFTKNLAENVVNDEFNANKFCCAIVRPSMVSPSLREPLLGWIDTLNGITGAVLMFAVGLARTGRGDLDQVIDAIPVDIVANTCIAAAWTASNRYETELRIYNCNVACLGGLVFRKTMRIAYDISIKYPVLKTVRPIAKPINQFDMFPVIFHFTRFFSETCFAVLCDFGLSIIGEKPFILKLMRRLHKIFDSMQCVIGRKWYFTNNCFVQLCNELVGDDKLIFGCDVRDIDWIKFVTVGHSAVKKIFLKEKDEDVLRAQQRYKL